MLSWMSLYVQLGTGYQTDQSIFKRMLVGSLVDRCGVCSRLSRSEKKSLCSDLVTSPGFGVVQICRTDVDVIVGTIVSINHHHSIKTFR